MSREEAISVLNDYDINFERHTAEEIAEAHEMAIKALQEHQHYKDLAESYEKTVNKLTKAIAEQQPEERTEKRTETHACDKKECWIEHRGTFKPHIECPKCGIWFLREDLPRNSYCPNCGSRNHWAFELKLEDGGKRENG